MLSSYAKAGSQEETVVVEDITAVARSAFGAIADPHTNGGLFVGGVTAPVGFLANSARSVFSNSTKTVYSNSLPQRKVNELAWVGRRNMN